MAIRRRSLRRGRKCRELNCNSRSWRLCRQQIPHPRPSRTGTDRRIPHNEHDCFLPLHDLSELVSPTRVGLIFLSAGLLGQIYGSLVAGRWGLGYAPMPLVVIYAATALRLATVPEGTRAVRPNGSMWEGYRPIFTLLGVRWRGWPDCSRQRSISRSKRYSHYLAEFGHGSCGWPSSKKRRHPGIATRFVPAIGMPGGHARLQAGHRVQPKVIRRPLAKPEYPTNVPPNQSMPEHTGL